MARAAEHITLKNGFELDCARRETDGDRVRLYLLDQSTNSGNYLEVSADSIQQIEVIPTPPASPTVSEHTPPNPADMHTMLSRAGQQHHIDVDILASIVHAESGGQVHAVSRTGARGLMQLMPATAAHLGVTNSFEPNQNISGGTAYLDQLLTRYHDDIALALAAYNAGPAAVDRWHGIPPYRETREYVARVIREFNRRKQAELMASSK